MTFPEQLRKWLPYVAVLLALFTLEAVVLPHMTPWLPCLLPLMVGIVGVLEGSTAGAAFGLGTGLLFSLQTPGMEGFFLFPLSLAGALSGLMPRHWGLSPFPACLVGGLGPLILLDLLRLLYFALLRGEAFSALLAIAGAELLLSALCLPLVYGLCCLAGGRSRPLTRRRPQKGVSHG
jgi:predicted membrane protein